MCWPIGKMCNVKFLFSFHFNLDTVVELCIPYHVFSAAAPPDLSGYSRSFLPSLPSHVTSFCYRGTPWLLVKQGKAIEEFRRMGSLQRADSTFPNTNQVQ